MTNLSMLLLLTSVGLVVYTYALYPVLLRLSGFFGQQPEPVMDDPVVWPKVSISLPAYNERHQIAETIESLLALDYPRDRLQILVISDASSDGTDEIVLAYRDRGVELLRLPERQGKGAAEIAAGPHLTGEIVVNTDASVRIARDGLKSLVRKFSDPAVGLASGRDISVAPNGRNTNKGESGYVGYEMGIRDLETKVGSIVGASGCFYAIRLHLHCVTLPISLSRDFAAALHCREWGYRAVSVSEAVCYVPRLNSLAKEYHRKVRTITRGVETLFFKRHLTNPFKHGVFAWMLFSHKACRWLVPWAGIAGIAAVTMLALAHPWARFLLIFAAALITLGGIGLARSGEQVLPWFLGLPAYVLMGNVAAMHGMLRAIHGESDALWEPTRRVPAD